MPTVVWPVVLLLPVEHQRLARMEDRGREPLSVGHGGLRPMLAVLVVVGELDLSGGHVVQRHIRDVGLERLSHPLSDQLDQRVEIELRRECLPDAVDRRELGHALPGLVHEPSVVERDAHAAGERRQQALVGIGEGVRPVGVLERDDAGRATADDERNEERRADRIAAQHVRVAVPLRHLRRHLVEHQRLARLHHVLAKADQRDRILVQPLTALDHVREERASGSPRRRPRC